MKTALSGGGMYNREAQALIQATRARAVVLLVARGYAGDAFEVQFVDDATGREVMANLPRVLRELADSIEKGEKPGP